MYRIVVFSPQSKQLYHSWRLFVPALSLRVLSNTITMILFTFVFFVFFFFFFYIYNRFHIWRSPNGYKCEKGHKCENLLLQMLNV